MKLAYTYIYIYQGEPVHDMHIATYETFFGSIGSIGSVGSVGARERENEKK